MSPVGSIGSHDRAGKGARKARWTALEDDLLRRGGVPEGRSAESAKSRRLALGIRRRAPKAAWTLEEDALVRAGDVPPGRTSRAIEYRRLAVLGINHGPRWTAREDALLRAGELPEGRSHRAAESRRPHLGIRTPRRPAIVLTTAYERLRHGSGPRTLGPGEILLRALDRAVPRTLPRHLRDDVIGTLTVDVLEGAVTLDGIVAAVRHAIARVYRLHPIVAAPLSLDAPHFADGRATLGDRISSEAGLWGTS